jgi:hypothetical protein
VSQLGHGHGPNTSTSRFPIPARTAYTANMHWFRNFLRAFCLGAVLVAAGTLAGAAAWPATGPAADPAQAAEAAHSAAVPFIEDDYRRALAQARSRKLPMFVEAWAPW